MIAHANQAGINNESQLRLGVTPFADLTPAEFDARLRSAADGAWPREHTRGWLGTHRWLGEALPSSVDWQASKKKERGHTVSTRTARSLKSVRIDHSSAVR